MRYFDTHNKPAWAGTLIGFAVSIWINYKFDVPGGPLFRVVDKREIGAVNIIKRIAVSDSAKDYQFEVVRKRTVVVLPGDRPKFIAPIHALPFNLKFPP